ncbi:MAG: lipid II flippase MurJ, partial [Brevinematia bacterium]
MLSLRGVFVNASGTFFSRILGLFKNIFVNFYFGLADTFWGAFQIINTFRIFVGEGAINNILIPLYKKIKEESPSSVKPFLVKSFVFVFALSSTLSLGLYLTAYPLAKAILPGFRESKVLESANSIMIMSLSVVLISTQSFLASIRIAKYGSFFSFAYAPVVANVLTIATILLLNHLGIYILSWAVVVGTLGMLL